MTQPPATDPPADPDAGLSDEEKVQKARVKSWVGEAFRETIAALRDEEEKAPERTKKPERSDVFGALFGTGGKKSS